jgi:gas vesicle protein
MSDRESDLGSFLSGLIIGGLVGAAAALLLAPQSGEETRAIIKEKGIELKDKAAETAEDVRVRTTEAAHKVQERGKQLYEEQKERVVKAIDAGKQAATRKKEETTGDIPLE